MPKNFIYLASGSPRRRELLGQIGVAFQVLDVAVDEAEGRAEEPNTYVTRIARLKAEAGLAVRPPERRSPILAADTTVVLDGSILGKPRDAADAARMLGQLSGRTHQVLTAVALASDGEVSTRVSTSEVTFREISAAEAAAYWATGEPHDKAGGYAIQGRAAIFVSTLRGSYSGVMGLPLFETAELLGRAGVTCWSAS